MMDNTPNTPVAEPCDNGSTNQQPISFSAPDNPAASAPSREEDNTGFVLGYN